MSLATLRTAVITRLGSPATDGFYSAAQLNDFVNDGVQALSMEFSWPWLQVQATLATVAGTGAYAIPATHMATEHLYIVGEPELERRSLAEINNLDDQSGQPTVYTIFAEQIYLRPVPDAVYTFQHQYSRTEPILTGDGDTPILPVAFQTAVVAFAASLAAQRAGQTADAQYFRDEYNMWLTRMRDQRRRINGPIRVRVRPGSPF